MLYLDSLRGICALFDQGCLFVLGHWVLLGMLQTYASPRDMNAGNLAIADEFYGVFFRSILIIQTRASNQYNHHDVAEDEQYPDCNDSILPKNESQIAMDKQMILQFMTNWFGLLSIWIDLYGIVYVRHLQELILMVLEPMRRG